MEKALSKLILQKKTFSPSDLREALLLDYNYETTTQNISNWLRRHPQRVKELKDKIGEIDAEHETIRYEPDYWIDNNLNSQIPVIQNWVNTLMVRKVKRGSIKHKVNHLRKICMGIRGFSKSHEQIMDWKLHPLALTEEKGMQFIVELNRKGFNDYGARLVIRNFLKFGKGEQPVKISGEKVFGKYGHIYAPKEKLILIFDYLKGKSYVTYAYCKFLFKTATRKTASIEAKLANLNEKEKTITVFDKGRKGQKQKWIKSLDDELLYDLQPLIAEGKLFEDLDYYEACNLCREAYAKYIPELAKQIPMPLHFWRHMFAQHMLRATDWNYTLVAMLGGWKDEKTLKDNYGMPPQAIVRKWGLDYIPKI